MGETEGYEGGEEEDICGDEDVVELDEAELSVMVKQCYNKLLNVPAELRAPPGKYLLVEIDTLKTPEKCSFLAYSTIGTYNSYEAAKQIARDLVKAKGTSYKIYDDESKCIFEMA